MSFPWEFFSVYFSVFSSAFFRVFLSIFLPIFFPIQGMTVLVVLSPPYSRLMY